MGELPSIEVQDGSLIARESSRVSVIVPTRNRQELLENAIQSVLDQTHQNVEIIVIDDGSDIPVARTSSLSSEKVTVIRLRESAGAAAARNHGIEASTGDYIAFVDDDDEWFAEKLAWQLDAMDGLDAKFVGVDVGYVAHVNGEIVQERLPDPRRDLRRELLKEPTLGPPMVLLRRDVLTQVGGFDPRLERYEDWDLWLRITDLGYDIAPLPQVGVKVRLHEGPTTSTRLHSYIEMLGRLRPRLRRRRRWDRLLLWSWHLRTLIVRAGAAAFPQLYSRRSAHRHGGQTRGGGT